MRIPHEDPDPDSSEPFEYQLDYPKEPNLTFDDFHPLPIGPQPQPQPQPVHHRTQAPKSHWIVVASKLQDLYTRFAAHNAIPLNPRLSPPDRRLVLTLYREALQKLEHAPRLVATKIHLEVIKKVTTVLDLRVAQPTDSVFYARDAFLSVLEPQYAHPRLDFYDRGGREGDDGYFWTGYGRLVAWREEGWPERVPVRAIEREERAREVRRRRGRETLRETAGEGLLRAMRGEMDWGEEIDADPARPWA